MHRMLWTSLIAGFLGVAGAAHAASFAEVDANGDGVISQDEFAAAYPESGADVWAEADANADGQITEDEHNAALEAGLLPAD